MGFKRIALLTILIVIMILIIFFIVETFTEKEAFLKIEGESKSVQTIYLTNDRFYSIFYDISVNPNSFVGKKINYEGFVYNYEESLFVCRKYYCCGTDSYTVGFECKFKDKTPKIDQWVEITGTIKIDQNDYPYVEVEKYEIKEERGQEIVYQ